MTHRYIDISGKTFGRLTAVRFVKVKSGNAYWECLCTCGNYKVVSKTSLRGGDTISCGCFRKEKATTHGQTKTRLYSIWTNMKTRCYNPNSAFWFEYGGRGIEICSEWLDCFASFEAWAEAAGYAEELEIDRKDVNAGYCPENCHWVDGYEQAYNKRLYRSNASGKAGVNWIERDSKWQARISVKGKRICLGLHVHLEDAVFAREQAEIKYYGGLKHAQSNNCKN